jgi:hypothetical protein|tara:strand:- start:1771 stop:2025 length:255 start_codon:yes stop_codon:yes gene_type:complete
MNRELEEYYDSLREMFNSSGWHHLTKDLDENLLNINSLTNVKDAEDMWFRKGQINILSFMLNLEESIKLTQDSAESEDSNAENL